MDAAPGQVIAGRFELLAPLGAGGMATVFRARDLRLEGVEVAVKIPRLGGDPQAVRRFHSEVLLARRVKHPGVCAVHEYGEDGELVYCVMELISGRNLRELLREAPVAWERAFEIAIDAAEGLGAIHEAGVLHRDVKSSNLMIDARGRVKLVDFGIAKIQRAAAGEDASADPELTGQLDVVGSPEYMSPEQVRGRPLDARSDLYSFGIVIHELFTGRVPFSGGTLQAVLVQQLEQDPCLDGPIADALPPGLAPILRKALAKDPGRRWASMAELAAALRRARASDPETAVLPRPAAATGGWRAKRMRFAVPVLALAVTGAILWERAWPEPHASPSLPPAARSPRATPSPVSPTSGAPAPTPSPTDAPAERVGPRPGRATAKPALNPSVTPAERQAPPQAASPGGSPQGPGGADVPATPPVLSPPTAGAVSTPSRPAAEPAFRRGDWLPENDAAVRPARCRADLPYCAQLEVLGIQGVVTFRVEVDDAGRVLSTQVVAFDDPLLRDCALRNLSRLRCDPGTKDGVPGRTLVTVPVAFSLK